MTDVRLGQVRPIRMRRIGARHMIVLPAQAAQVLSIDDIERTLRTARLQLQQLEGQVERQRAFVADIEQQLAAFAALPVQRIEDDPDVPQPEPVAPRQLARLVTPAAGLDPQTRAALAQRATPVPPPELTAADG